MDEQPPNNPRNKRKRPASAVSGPSAGMDRKPPPKVVAFRNPKDTDIAAQEERGSKAASEYASVASLASEASKEHSSVAPPPSDTSAHGGCDESYSKASNEDNSVAQPPSDTSAHSDYNKSYSKPIVDPPGGLSLSDKTNNATNNTTNSASNNTTNNSVVQKLRRALQKKFNSTVGKLKCHKELVGAILEEPTITQELADGLVHIAKAHGYVSENTRNILKQIQKTPELELPYQEYIKVSHAFSRLHNNAKDVDSALDRLAVRGQESRGGTMSVPTKSQANTAIGPPLSDNTNNATNNTTNSASNNTTNNPVVQKLQLALRTEFKSTVEKLNCHATLVDTTIVDCPKLTMPREVADELVNIANAHGHVPQTVRDKVNQMPSLIGQFPRMDAVVEFLDNKASIVSAFQKLRENANLVKSALDNLAVRGQESPGGTMSVPTESQANTPSTNTPSKKFLDAHQQGAPLAGDSPPLKGAPDSIVMFDGVGALNPAKLELDETEKKWLEDVSRKFGSWLANSKIVYKDNEKAEWKEKLKKGNDYLRADLKGEQDLNEENMYCPSMIALEVPGCQPAFEALLSSMNPPKNQEKQPFSPPKYPEENIRIPKTKKRPARCVDFVLKKPGQYQLLMVDSAIELPIEIKPIFRRGQTPKTLEEECMNQVYGHLAKYNKQCFHFKAHGTPSFATGVIGTLAYIRVIQLHLVNNPDTGEFGLEHKASKYLPLISKAHFHKWWEKHDDKWTKRKEKDYNELVEKLYPDGDKDEGIIGGIPKGYLALWKMKNESRSSFFGPSWKGMFEVDGDSMGEPGYEVGDILGQGSYGLVFEAKQNNKATDCVFKTSALSSDLHLKNEQSVLNSLNQNQGPGQSNDFLSILKEEVTLNLKIGSLNQKVGALLLSPKGVPLINYLHSNNYMDNDETKSNAAKTVTNDMQKALKHMHQNGFVHNDISPKNMIAVRTGNKGFKVCLIDFGIASEKGRDPGYCIGTVLYMHDDVLKAHPRGCETKDAHDHCGLSLTVTTILSGGYPEWDMKGFPKTSNGDLVKVLVERTKTAKRKIRESKLEKSIKKILNGWLDKK